jgi:hypothetical protein
MISVISSCRRCDVDWRAFDDPRRIRNRSEIEPNAAYGYASAYFRRSRAAFTNLLLPHVQLLNRCDLRKGGEFM